jgi:hypothetical protein
MAVGLGPQQPADQGGQGGLVWVAGHGLQSPTPTPEAILTLEAWTAPSLDPHTCTAW